MKLVRVWHDNMAGAWRLSCAVCGPLGEFRGFWVASRAADAHEKVHEDD
jgi:hypothetical protein